MSWLVVLLLVAPDAGVSPSLRLAPLLEEMMAARMSQSAARQAEFVATAQSARDGATPAQQALLDRMVRLMDLDPGPQATFRALVELSRSALQLARGDFLAERALTAAFVSFPQAARGYQVDPAPLRREALALTRELVRRYPREASARELLAGALLARDEAPSPTRDAGPR